MHRTKTVVTIAVLTAMMLSLQLLAPRIAGQARGSGVQAQLGTGSLKISGQILTTIPPSDLMFPAQGARAGGAASGRGGATAAAAATLYLVQRDAAGVAMATQQMRGGAMTTGPFEIPNVRPGLYDLFVSLPDSKGWGPSAAPGQAVQPLGFGRVSFEARGDVTGLQVTVHQGVDLKGRVTVDGKPGGPAGLQILVEPDARAMAIQPYQFIGRFQPAVGADGSFTFPALPEAQYQVRVGMTGSSNLTLADIVLDGKSVKSSGINIDARPPGTIEIALKTGAPALTSIAPNATARGAVSAVASTQQSQILLGAAVQPVQPPASSPLSPASASKGDGGLATAAVMDRATALAADGSGNLFIVDSGRVRKVGADGVIRVYAGTGTQGYKGDNGPAIDAGFEFAADLAVDSKGNLYIADNLAHRVRMVSPDGKIRTVAGTGEPGFSGDGGPATAAKLQSPVRVAVDAAGNIYIADGGNARIRKVTSTGVISTVVGVGRTGFSGDGGAAVSAQIGLVVGLGVDGAGNIYIADADSARVRKIAANGGVITTIAGKGGVGSNGDGGPAKSAQIQLFNLAVDGPGNVFVVEANRIRKVGADGVIRMFAGSVTSGFSGDGGPATSAELRAPAAIALDGKGNLFIADTLNGRIRKVAADGTIVSVAGSATPPPAMVATLQQPQAARGNRATGQANVQTLGGFVGNNGNVATVVNAPQLPATAPSGRPTLLETRLGMIPHTALTTVKDCGHVPKESAAAAVACVEESLRAKTPFVASFEQRGIDSVVVIGLGGTAPDSVVQVLFDGSGGNAARVSAPRDCSRPKITVAGASVQVACN